MKRRRPTKSGVLRGRAVYSTSMRELVMLLLCLLLTKKIVRGDVNLQVGNQCRLVAFLPFTDLRITNKANSPSYLQYGYGVWPGEYELQRASFSLLATIDMAQRHFNERNTSVVPELANFTHCPIRFHHDTFYFDSAYHRRTILDEILSRVFKQLNTFLFNDSSAGTSSSSSAVIDPRREVCAMVGPIEEDAVETTALFAETLKVPLAIFASSHEMFDDVAVFPTVRRFGSADVDLGRVTGQLLHRGDVWHRDYVAVLYEDDYYDDFASALEEYADTTEEETGSAKSNHHQSMRVWMHAIRSDNEHMIASGLDHILEGGWRTVVIAVSRPALMEMVAELASQRGLVQDQKIFWVVLGDAFPPALDDFLQYPIDSPVDRLLQGAALVTNYDPVVYEEDGSNNSGRVSPFLQAWRDQDGPSILPRLELQQPDTSNFFPRMDYFQTDNPTPYASYLYDSVISTGLAACVAQNTGLPHADAMKATAFHGASGRVVFGENGKPNSRSSGITYGVYNIRAGVPVGDQRRYTKVLTAEYRDEYTFESEQKRGKEAFVYEGAWKTIPGTDFFFADGTITEPFPTREVTNAYYLSHGIQLFGFIAVALAMILIMGTAAWVVTYRETRIVKASQPEFIYLLCAGSGLVAISLLFFSFDEGKGLSVRQLSTLCAVFPWFFTLGYLSIYSALFCKLWRLSQLMQMRRRVIHMKQVLVPFAAVILLTVAVLTLQQALDPPEWKRVEVDASNPATYETFGQCTLEGSESLHFVLPLVLLIVIQIIVTAVVAWQLRDVQAELAESRWIFFGIVSHIQVWALGIPIVYITSGVSKDAQYLMYTTVIFVLSTSMVTLVVWPKIYAWATDSGPKRTRPNIGITSNGGRTHVSGLNVVQNTRISSFSQDGRISDVMDQSQPLVVSGASEIEKSGVISTTGNTVVVSNKSRREFDGQNSNKLKDTEIPNKISAAKRREASEISSMDFQEVYVDPSSKQLNREGSSEVLKMSNPEISVASRRQTNDSTYAVKSESRVLGSAEGNITVAHFDPPDAREGTMLAGGHQPKSKTEPDDGQKLHDNVKGLSRHKSTFLSDGVDAGDSNTAMYMPISKDVAVGGTGPNRSPVVVDADDSSTNMWINETQMSSKIERVGEGSSFSLLAENDHDPMHAAEHSINILNHDKTGAFETRSDTSELKPIAMAYKEQTSSSSFEGVVDAAGKIDDELMLKASDSLRNHNSNETSTTSASDEEKDDFDDENDNDGQSPTSQAEAKKDVHLEYETASLRSTLQPQSSDLLDHELDEFQRLFEESVLEDTIYEERDSFVPDTSDDEGEIANKMEELQLMLQMEGIV